jgi:Bax protein
MADQARFSFPLRRHGLLLGSAAAALLLLGVVGWTIRATIPDLAQVAQVGGRAGIPTLLMDSRPQIDRLVRPVDAAHLERVFKSLDYDLGAVRRGDARVPRVYVTALPTDLAKVVPTKRRKALFIGSVLPLVLIANEELRKLRARVEALRSRLEQGDPLSRADESWLERVATRFGARAGRDLTALLRRVDEVPVSLALAQSIEESGWGTSRFARQGNALFGQRTWSKTVSGVVPADYRGTRSFRVRSYMNLMGAVRAYMHNLNSHAAYRELRALRAEQRAAGRPVDGYALAGSLGRYSERGEAYIEQLRGLMRANRLAALDRARLPGRD